MMFSPRQVLMWMLLMSVYINNRKVILFYFVFFLISWIYQLFSCPEKLEVHHHPRLAILALHTNVPDHYMNYTWSVITTTTTTSLMLINIPAGKVFSGSLVWILDGTHHSYTPCLWPAKPPIDQAQSYSLQEQDKGWVSEGGKKDSSYSWVISFLCLQYWMLLKLKRNMRPGSRKKENMCH